MLWEHVRDYGFGMDALVIVCSGNTNGIIVWAWMLWSSYALGTRTRLWFGHGCSGQRMLWAHERDYGLGMDALVSIRSGNTNGIMVWAWMLWSSYALGTRTRLWFGHGCSGQRMLWAHERDYGLGMDALVSVCSGNTNGVMGDCRWSPGTWRRWSQTPSIPLNKLSNTLPHYPLILPYVIPYGTPLRSLDYGSYCGARPGLGSTGCKVWDVEGVV